ncbi:triose-phosphate isomerase [Desulfovibrio legallii]|jgi:triosephosphate isomerase|uniref:Triosephosphate isomerase n=1 Tax=Desulfovibrio legallii TaxID=571438 RepID=A0A1G7KKG7_9BACT|nr:triose-phosphate isomerase [Desulfovibrio legallii]SDF37534.1 triosephosphate isomerase [Desulfovibrio legallii]
MKTIIAANWKMFKTRADAASYAVDLARGLEGGLPAGREVLLFPPYTALAVVAEAAGQTPGLAVGGQNVYPDAEGAFTGEISPAMLLDAGASWVLAGHSERRHIFHEDPAFVARKAAFALEQGLNVMLCVGETLSEREAGRLEAVLEAQLAPVCAALPPSLGGEALARRLAVAYEPVWAIGTGKVAGPPEVQEAHAVTRALLQRALGDAALQLPVLYGGSVKPANAATLLGLDNVNGLLVGGASLEAQSFLQIVFC